MIAVSAAGEIEMIYNTEGMKRASINDANNLFVATFE